MSTFTYKDIQGKGKYYKTARLISINEIVAVKYLGDGWFKVNHPTLGENIIFWSSFDNFVI